MGYRDYYFGDNHFSTSDDTCKDLGYVPEGLKAADEIGTYLKEKGAELVAGMGKEINGEIIDNIPESYEADWCYHIFGDTSLFINFTSLPVIWMDISISAQGGHARQVLSDLEGIILKYVKQ